MLRLVTEPFKFSPLPALAQNGADWKRAVAGFPSLEHARESKAESKITYFPSAVVQGHVVFKETRTCGRSGGSRYGDRFYRFHV